MRAAITLSLSVLAAGCNALTTETFGDAGPAPPTSVSMDPDAFLVGTPDTPAPVCADLPGAMQSYVATITDVTDLHTPFTLPSSPPLPCSQSVYFDYVAIGHVYQGVVDGYTQPANELVPVCSLAGVSTACDGVSCPSAYGCPGACEVTSYGTQDDACLTACGIDLSCLKQHPCVETTAAAFASCVQACVKNPTPENKAIAEQCLSNTQNHSCLLPAGSKLDQPCPSVTAPGAGVKGCTCVYPTANGDRHMTGTKPSSAIVAPRWTTDMSFPCVQPSPTQPYVNTGLVACGALEDMMQGSTPTGIQLYPTSTLYGGLACASSTTGADAGAGTITTFDITPADPSLVAYVGVACDPAKTVTWTQNVVAGAPYTFTVQSHVAGSTTPTEQATCVATAENGVTVVAKCDPLSPIPTPKPKPKP